MGFGYDFLWGLAVTWAQMRGGELYRRCLTRTPVLGSITFYFALKHASLCTSRAQRSQQHDLLLFWGPD